MNKVVELEIASFALVYLLLLLVLVVMKKSKVQQSSLLLWASFRMTVQLILAGWILTYIFENPHPVFVLGYFLSMNIFAIHRVLSKNKSLNRQFKIYIALSLSLSGLFVVIFFIRLVVGESLVNPQYVIPLSGMMIGNAMTGVTLGVKTFRESFEGQRNKINALLNIGASPKKILLPFANQALETALLPTMNSMLGMGIISLPGMMTGQILSGTSPSTAVLYQIAIMIAVTTVVCLSVFFSLFLGYRTLYNKRWQIKS
ncbi:MAG: ABC transporter permease [Anaerovoracaceae bacterium]|jgi:putative ABC transport system permease protein|nr:ABC transporter permease [Anaerovoracaceae bacterium]